MSAKKQSIISIMCAQRPINTKIVISQIFKLFVLFPLTLLITSSDAREQLISPCPKVFEYEGEPQYDRWYGIVSFSSAVELVGLTYKIHLDRPAQLLVTWDGEVRSDDNTEFSIFNPYHFQRAGEIVKSRIMVKYNPLDNPPRVMKIVINGMPVCSRDDANAITLNSNSDQEQGNQRPDPIFSDDIVVSRHYGGLGNERPMSERQMSERSMSEKPVNERPVNKEKPANEKPNNPEMNVNRPSNQIKSSDNSSNNDNSHKAIPSVTTLTLPNDKQTKNNNMDVIVQMIKNKLEQEGTLSANNTIFFTVVNPGSSDVSVTKKVSTQRNKDTTDVPVHHAPSSGSSETHRDTRTSSNVRVNKN